jgi:hypothetical protein
MAELPVGMIFSGSGTVRTEGKQHLVEKIEYLEDLGEQIHRLYKEGLSARRIRRRLLGRDPTITFLTLGHFSGQILVQSYLAGFEPQEPAQAEETGTEQDEAGDQAAGEDAGK